MTDNNTNKTNWSICWDCHRATGGCPWSDSLTPVEGWVATKRGPSNAKPYSTYIVHECPGFIRDAYGGGTKRVPKELRL